MDRNLRVIEGTIEIDGKEIKKVGNVKEKDADKVIDASGKIVMPGLVCSHAQPHRVLLRSAPLSTEPPSEITQIQQRLWWNIDEKLTNKDAYDSTLFTCLKFIKTGTTFFADTYSSQKSIGKSLDHIASAVEEAGIRALIAFEASERNTRAEGARGMRENIRFLENLQKKGPRESLTGGLVGLDASLATSNELLKHGKRVANRFDVSILMPVSEGKNDVYHNLEKHGKRPIERLRDVDLLSPNTVLAHCIHVNQDELDIIQRTGSKVAHNPMSNMINAAGVAPIPNMKEREIPIGLGNGDYITDGFENIRSLYMLHKVISGDPRKISPMEALEMATIKSAELYGMGNKIGSIEPGKRADIIIIDPSSLPTPLLRENAANHLVNSITGRDVETVIVGGKLLMENGDIKTLTESRTIEQARGTAKKIWKKLEFIKR